MPTHTLRALNANEQAIVDAELALLAKTREALGSLGRASSQRIRDEEAHRALREAYAEAGEEDRPALLAQLHEAHARMSRARPAQVPDLWSPYFAHLRVRVAGRERDILLGKAPFVDAKHDVTIVEWRKSPIAEVFFCYEEGDHYEVELPDRRMTGTLLDKRLVEINHEGLQSITLEHGKLCKHEGQWMFEPSALAPVLLEPGIDPRKIEHAGLSVRLDAQQQALVDRDEKDPLLVLGSAGSGKTTVALHRLVALHRRNPEAFPAEKMLVLVPEPGLRRLSERTLLALGLEGVFVSTFDDWARKEARRVFPWVHARESPDPPYAVSRMKRDPGMIAAIATLLEEEALAAAARIDRVLGLGGALVSHWQAQRGNSIAERWQGLEKTLKKWVAPEKLAMVRDALHEERKTVAVVKEEWRRLIGDQTLLREVVRASEGALSEGLVEITMAHTRRQLEESSEKRFAHVDAERRATLDGASLDEGTPEASASTLDVEDYALLFELLHQKTGKSETRSGKLSQYAHIVVDEAQELSPIELRLVGRAIAPGGSVTVAGDAAQRMDRTGHFRSWEVVLSSLGLGDHAPALLETSYRSPRPIVELGHAVLGEDAPLQMPRATREGPAVLRTVVPEEGHAAAVLCEALRRLREEDPLASIAVIARDAEAAARYQEAVSRGLLSRLVSEQEGDFRFGPGLEVTSANAVRGLEFDYVVAVDVSRQVYPDNGESRRTLHVVVTRAMQRVWLLAVGEPSPIAGFSR